MTRPSSRLDMRRNDSTHSSVLLRSEILTFGYEGLGRFKRPCSMLFDSAGFHQSDAIPYAAGERFPQVLPMTVEEVKVGKRNRLCHSLLRFVALWVIYTV